MTGGKLKFAELKSLITDLKNKIPIKTRSAIYKMLFIAISLFFCILNFPLLDWFLHSEKMWYNEYELNPDTSFLYTFYEKKGVLEETLGFIYSMTYGSTWMHVCYHLYNFRSCVSLHPVYAGCVVFLILMFLLARSDIKIHKEKNRRNTFIFYAIPFIAVITICIYGCFVYAPQYNSTIIDIIECI